MSAVSSIHIARGAAGYFMHNDRTTATKNSIFHDEKNECSASSKEAFETYRKELRARAEAYSARTGQALQKNAITHLSAIVNLHAHHTLADVQRVAALLEERFDTRVLQVAIHRDEGHIDDDGNAVKNYHAHIEFLGIDSDGYSVRRKLDRRALSELQDAVAETLQMQRGTKYAKERKQRPRRLDTYDFKAAKEAEQKARKDDIKTVKALKAEIEKMRKKMASSQLFDKEDYDVLNALKKRTKKATLLEAFQEFATLQQRVDEKIKEQLVELAAAAGVTVTEDGGRRSVDQRDVTAQTAPRIVTAVTSTARAQRDKNAQLLDKLKRERDARARAEERAQKLEEQLQRERDARARAEERIADLQRRIEELQLQLRQATNAATKFKTKLQQQQQDRRIERLEEQIRSKDEQIDALKSNAQQSASTLQERIDALKERLKQPAATSPGVDIDDTLSTHRDEMIEELLQSERRRRGRATVRVRIDADEERRTCEKIVDRAIDEMRSSLKKDAQKIVEKIVRQHAQQVQLEAAAYQQNDDDIEHDHHRGMRM